MSAILPTEPESEVAAAPRAGSGTNLFATDHLRDDLKRHSVRGGFVTLASQAIKFAISTISTMALARLLTPADFGVIAMVSPLTGFIGLFKDLGLSMATVQKEDITHEQVSTLFWVNVAVSFGLMLVAAALSPAVGWFYGDYRTTWVTLAIASSFIFGGLTAQHSAILQRNMRFRALATIEVATLATSLVVGIITALSGWKYWSLVAMTLAAGFVNCVSVWLASPWRPGKPSRNAGTRSLLQYGSRMTAATVIAYAVTQLDRLALGRFWMPPGAASMTSDEVVATRKAGLGIYTRSHMLFLTPLLQVMGPLDSVMFPMFSRLANDRARLKKAAAQIMELAAAIMLPIAIGCFFCANEVVHVLLGSDPKWAEAVPVTRAFAIVAVTFPVGLVVNGLLMATGRSDVLVKWEIFWMVILIPSIAIMLPRGPVGVAMAVGFGAFLIAPIHLYIAHRVASLDLRQMAGLVFRNLFSVVLCGGAILLAQGFVEQMPDLARAGIFGFLILVFHGLSLYLFGTTARIKDLIRIGRSHREA